MKKIKKKWCRRSKCRKSYINPNLCELDEVFEVVNVVSEVEWNLLNRDSDLVNPHKEDH